MTGRVVLVVFDADEWEQADRADVDAWLDRQALERELERRRARRGDPQ
jgi:hypothetical protein